MEFDKLQQAVFTLEKSQFNDLAMQVFQTQSRECEVYQRYLNCLQVDATKIIHLEDIPYLPIEFFKQFEVKTNSFKEELIFESSSTTGKGISRHFVKSVALYQQAFESSFKLAFGSHQQYCHLALLPSYLERQNSSLVYQVNGFIEDTKNLGSSFYLHQVNELLEHLKRNEAAAIPTLLWGVSFALLDFIEKFNISLKHTIVLETGGMKGRRKEITRDEMHSKLKQAFSISSIAGEYGMTELMSQAYAVKDGLYTAPNWMRISAREINDPLSKPIVNKHGAINIIDLANIHSCAFIASSDLGKVYADGTFEILGRIDHSDTRGCNLLV
jgi:phenylacetate-coenzyme A ligase PaaK-like adenylate-forming protein